jgi:hypothetical protein
LGLVDVATLIEALERSIHRFTPDARETKWHALTALAERPISDGALLLRFHEALCFVRAYPDDARLLARVEDALAKFGRRVAALGESESSDPADALAETGVASTVVSCPLSLPILRWLVARFPDSVEIDWDDADNDGRLGRVLPALVPIMDEDALVEAGVRYRDWLGAAKAGRDESDLAWILREVDRARLGARIRPDFELGVTWRLGETLASRTLARVGRVRVFFQRRALARARGPLRSKLPGPPIPVRLVSRAEAVEFIDAGRAALTVRHREVHAFNFASPDDVVVAECGRGTRIAWLGVRPAHRLPLRAHYGYLLLKNGVPLGYGDTSLLFDWAEVAFNVFETFRRGESASSFLTLLRFLHQHLGVRAFHLSPYQIGDGNDEALDSGAFWFYDKLGFRPKADAPRRLAAEERRRLAREVGARSSRDTLARLCLSGMFAGVDSRTDRVVAAFEAVRIGLGAAREAARTGSTRLTTMVAGWLEARKWRRWPPPERAAFERLAPFLALIPDLPRWSARERQALVDLVRAKGGTREIEYVQRLQAHRRLRTRLLELGGGRRIRP